MPERNRELSFRKGFIGPPIPPDQVGQGVQVMENVRLTLSGAAFEQMLGFRRTYLHDTLQSAASPTGECRVVSLPPQAFGMSYGRGLAVVDESNGRVLGLAYHPSGIVEDTTAPTTLGTLNRQGLHDYPCEITYGNLTHHCTPWDEQFCFDGSDHRRVGIRAPQRAPTLSEQVGGTPATVIDDGSTTWIKNVALTNSDIEIADDGDTSAIYSSGNINAAPNDAYHFFTLDINDDDATPTLCSINVAGTIADTFDTIALWFRVRNKNGDLQGTFIPRIGGTAGFWSETTDENGFIRRRWNPGTPGTPGPAIENPYFSLIFASQADLAGELFEVPIMGNFPANQWQRKLCTQMVKATENGKDVFADLKANLPAWIKTTGYASIGLKLKRVIWDEYYFSDDNIYISFESIEKVISGTSAIGEPTKYSFAFSWYDSKRMRESAISPATEGQTLSTGTLMAVDLAGYVPGVMGSKVANTVNGMLNSNPDASFVDKYRLYVNNPVWDLDELGRPQYRLIQEGDIPTPDGSGRMLVSVGAGKSDEELRVSRTGRMWIGPPPACNLAINDGQRLLFSGVQGYSRGRVKVVNDDNFIYALGAYKNDGTGVIGYYAIAPGAGYTFQDGLTPKWDRHLEGREIRIGDDQETYYIIKCVNFAANEDFGREFNALFVARDVDEKPYQGTSTNGTAGTATYGETYGIQGYPNRVYYSIKDTGGIDTEAVGLLNYLDLEMPGDEIVGLGHVGDFIIACGRMFVYYLLQDNAALDDLGSAPFTNPRLVHGAPGCIAGRSLVQLPNRQAMYLCQGPSVALATTEGVSVHPLAHVIEGWLRQASKNDPMSFRYAHAIYDQVLQWYVLFLQESEYSAGVGGAVTRRSDAYRADPVLDPGDPGGETVPTADAYDYPFPWTNGLNPSILGGTNDFNVPEVYFTPWCPLALDAVPNGTGAQVWTNPRSEEVWTRPYISDGRMTPLDNQNKVACDGCDSLPTGLDEETGDNSYFPDAPWQTFVWNQATDGAYTFNFHKDNKPDTTHPFANFWTHSVPAGPTGNDFCMIDGKTKYLIAWFYVSGATGQSIPANTFKWVIAPSSGAGGSYEITIDQALPCGEWTLVVWDVEASPPVWNKSYTDSEDVATNAFVFHNQYLGTSIDVYTILELPDAVFDDNDLTVYIAGGRQVRDMEVSPEIPAEVAPTYRADDTYAPPCSVYGATGYSGTIANDFRRMLVLDLLNEAAVTGIDFPIACTVGQSAPCAVIGTVPDRHYGGDITGWINRLFGEDAFGLGTPSTKIRWTITAATMTAITVNTSAGDLPIGGDALKDLPVTIILADGTVIERVISSNTRNVVTVTSAIPSPITPVAGDVLYLAPMTCTVRFREERFIHPARLKTLIPNLTQDASETPDAFTFNIYAASGTGIQASYSVVAAAKDFSAADLNVNRGRIWLAPKNSKALAYELTWIAYGGGRVQFGPVRVIEDLHPLEQLRNRRDA